MITSRDFLSTIITHPIATVVRATCLRTSRPWSDEILEVYAIDDAFLNEVRRVVSDCMWVVLLGPFTGVYRVFEMLLHQHLMAFRIAERLKWPKKLIENRK